jgi:hypothetical protein
MIGFIPQPSAAGTHRREHVAMLGHRQSGHLQLHRLVEEFVDPAGAVEQREFSVQV